LLEFGFTAKQIFIDPLPMGKLECQGSMDRFKGQRGITVDDASGDRPLSQP